MENETKGKTEVNDVKEIKDVKDYKDAKQGCENKN